MSDTREQRIYERFDSDMAIWARLDQSEDDFLLLEIVNISAGGLLFQLDHELALGTRVELRFELPQNNDLVESLGEVRHMRCAAEGQFLIGVQFIEVQNYSIPVLMAYLEAIFK